MKKHPSQMTPVEFMKHFDDAAREAARRDAAGDKSLVKLFAGSYLAYRNGELIEIYYHDDDHKEWMVAEVNRHWYLDPLPTLTDCRAVIETLQGVQ